MAKITENDIVTFLHQKIDSLTAELKKTQDVLDALVGSSSVASKLAVAAPVRKSLGSESMADKRGRKQSETAEIGTTDMAPVKKRAGRPKLPVSASLEAPTGYDSKLKMESKVAYALAKTGPAFKEDVTKILNDLEPEADPKKLDKDVTVKLSSLYKKGRIKAEREGRKYRYSL